MKKMLVVYYSWSNGNTKRIAEQLTDGTGADIARIETQSHTAAVMKMWLNREKRGRGRLYASDQSDICKSC